MYTLALYLSLFAVGQTCHWNDKCTYNYFGSKTVYDDVRGDIRDAPELKGCKPVGVWAMMRHGIRHPSSSNLPNMLAAAELKDNIVRSHLEGRGELCAQDITNLQNWVWLESLTNATTGHLTPEGYQELYKLGARFQERFLPLLKELDQYHFRPTFEQRTIESAKAFVEGLGGNIFKFTLTNATDRDDVLRPYYYCTKHTTEVYLGPRSTLEMEKYHETKEFQSVLENVQKRTGLEDPLSTTNLTGLYNLCRYFKAYGSRTSPWCALFSSQDLGVIEYLNDLRHYYRNGYGSPINLKLGRPALKDLFENFHSMVQGRTKSVVGYFSHDSMLQMMYAALGLFRDYPMISGFERDPNRKWRTSFITPFAANFVSVLHKCSDKTTLDSYQVQFFINEKELHLCQARTCSWSQFVEKFQPFLDSSLEFCHTDNTNSSSAKSVDLV